MKGWGAEKFGLAGNPLGEGKWGRKKCRRIPKREGDWQGRVPKCSLPGKTLENKGLELPIFEGSLPSCSPHFAGYTRTSVHPYFPVAKSRDFCRDIPGAAEKFEKKNLCVQFSSPTMSGRRIGKIAVGRGFANSSLFQIQVISPRKVAKFSLNFWPVRVHEKPSFRYVPNTLFANTIFEVFSVIPCDCRRAMFLEFSGLGNHWEQWIAESLGLPYLRLAISVEDLPNLGVKFLGPFVAGNCAAKPIHWLQNLKGGGVRISTDNAGKLQNIGR